MTRFDPQIEMLLESARAAREPSSADRARNLDAVKAKVGVLPVDPRAMSSMPPPATTIAERSSAAAGAAALRAAGKLVAAGIVTCALGVLIGFELGRRSSDSVAADDVAAPVAVRSAVAGRVDGDPAPATMAVGKPAEVSSSRQVERLPEPRPVAKPLEVGSKRAARSVAKGGARSHAAVDRSFFQVLRLVERAQRALDAGEPSLSLSLLEEIDARFSPAVLDEERRATRALAWCALGERARATTSAERLLAENPRSIYAERLGRSCVAENLTGADVAHEQ